MLAGAPQPLCLACIYLVLLKSLPSWKRGWDSSAYMCSAHKNCLGCNLFEVILTERPRSGWLDHVEGFHNTFENGGVLGLVSSLMRFWGGVFSLSSDTTPYQKAKGKEIITEKNIEPNSTKYLGL